MFQRHGPITWLTTWLNNMVHSVQVWPAWGHESKEWKARPRIEAMPPRTARLLFQDCEVTRTLLLGWREVPVLSCLPVLSWGAGKTTQTRQAITHHPSGLPGPRTPHSASKCTCDLKMEQGNASARSFFGQRCRWKADVGRTLSGLERSAMAVPSARNSGLERISNWTSGWGQFLLSTWGSIQISMVALQSRAATRRGFLRYT